MFRFRSLSRFVSPSHRIQPMSDRPRLPPFANRTLFKPTTISSSSPETPAAAAVNKAYCIFSPPPHNEVGAQKFLAAYQAAAFLVFQNIIMNMFPLYFNVKYLFDEGRTRSLRNIHAPSLPPPGSLCNTVEIIILPHLNHIRRLLGVNAALPAPAQATRTPSTVIDDPNDQLTPIVLEYLAKRLWDLSIEVANEKKGWSEPTHLSLLVCSLEPPITAMVQAGIKVIPTYACTW
jgi:hypothetical protein